jgi:outer membrane lipoprotein-sorting protein
MKYKLCLFACIMLLMPIGILMQSHATIDLSDPKVIVKKASENRYGEKSFGKMRMEIKRPKYTRSIEMKNWTMGNDYSMVLITAPSREKGQVFLKREREMYNYIPKINRLVKLPPSMMSQGWMGSDYSNDDIVNQNSLVRDYTHTLVGTEQTQGMNCYKIISIPKKDADVVWGKKINWISKDGLFVMKTESYDEDGELVRTELASNVKMFGTHRLPSKFEIIPADKPKNKTLFEILEMDFTVKLDAAFFTKANMKRVK